VGIVDGRGRKVKLELNASEAGHRLALREEQKENKGK